jgi:hypothetical protein
MRRFTFDRQKHADQGLVSLVVKARLESSIELRESRGVAFKQAGGYWRTTLRPLAIYSTR